MDLTRTAFVETDEPDRLAKLIGASTSATAGNVSVTHADPQRIEVHANLLQPGLVVLAALHYPGWKLEVDGTPTPILRANRMMRGAFVPEGNHTLVYTYCPASLRFGLLLSPGGLAITPGLIHWATRCIRREPLPSFRRKA